MGMGYEVWGRGGIGAEGGGGDGDWAGRWPGARLHSFGGMEAWMGLALGLGVGSASLGGPTREISARTLGALARRAGPLSGIIWAFTS